MGIQTLSDECATHTKVPAPRTITQKCISPKNRPVAPHNAPNLRRSRACAYIRPTALLTGPAAVDTISAVIVMARAT